MSEVWGGKGSGDYGLYLGGGGGKGRGRESSGGRSEGWMGRWRGEMEMEVGGRVGGGRWEVMQSCHKLGWMERYVSVPTPVTGRRLRCKTPGRPIKGQDLGRCWDRCSLAGHCLQCC